MGPNAAAVIIRILTFLSLVIKRFVSSVLMLTTFDLQNLFCSVLRRGDWKDLGWEVFV